MTKRGKLIRITDQDGKRQTGDVELFDEFVADGANIHFEDMGQNNMWCEVSVGGRTFHINFWVEGRSKLRWRCEDVS